MKIIFLNTLNAQLESELRRFTESKTPTTDIFCFQEVGASMQSLARELLGDYTEILAEKTTGETEYAVATYVKHPLKIASRAALFADDDDGGLGVYAEIRTEHMPIHLLNFHGAPVPDKLDTPETVAQSCDMIKLLKDKPGFRIAGGDFNVLPDTTSISLFEREGYKNAIREYNIPTTRNRIAWEKYEKKFRFSDYVFTDPVLRIRNFTVPDVVVSDHLPMILEFEL